MKFAIIEESLPTAAGIPMYRFNGRLRFENRNFKYTNAKIKHTKTEYNKAVIESFAISHKLPRIPCRLAKKHQKLTRVLHIVRYSCPRHKI
jgi:hypothetical protein